ncbi:MAG TPA: hypothetical protein VJ965_12295 [Anaerolineales bacterium]|nr:hypothetical protein [Anaerolineales bacterium]
MNAPPVRSLSIKSILASFLNGLASVVDFIFCIPVLGRVLKWLWNSILTLIQVILGLLENAMGYKPIKKLRFGVLILKDEEGNLLTTPDAVYAEVARTQEILAQAKVEIIPAFPPVKMLPEGGTLPESGRWIRTARNPSPGRMLDVGCDGSAMIQDLMMPGLHYQMNTIRTFFSTAFRRVFGLGAPITVFIVRDIKGKAGCSIGWLGDYVTLQHNFPLCMAHEIGHACNLLHSENPENLMYPKSCKPSTLTTWQIILLRSSRHVSYF